MMGHDNQQTPQKQQHQPQRQPQQQPPSEFLHPLSLLDEYLYSTMETRALHATNKTPENNSHHDDSNGDDTTFAHPTIDDDKEAFLEDRRTCVLQVADFLYGGSSNSNILESALAVLDSPKEHTPIQRIQSKPSGRIAYVVKGTTKNTKGRNSQSSSSSLSNNHYYCLMPPLSSKHRQIQQKSPSPSLPSLFYCSCRSYFEKAKLDPKAICKHLLALKLMEHMECPCNEISVSDTEYANLILQKVFV